MAAAVWRPTEREAYPVLGIEEFRCNGTVAAVVELPDGSKCKLAAIVDDIEVQR
ncbi:hypothetical protein SEA_MCKLOVIN_43 [Gordonia phage Mcklovin]|uniref:DUF7323 domain-containing protein n=2 Tax=Howevirus TaxID=3044733 RepID=A0A0U4JHC3_9CAUD|nr:hypothetical protein PP513_gp47 [Gordonia phage Howe]YP_010654984.1 hypothetical protein PP514_gp43 [Gordonia phage Mcklovin]AZF93232.1 hypothetical protein SEA_ADORA_44 [Gordonia phage Adora]QYC54446.1 hypothetical protein SEA_SHLIM410_45 [Gordonia phage Shlim410]ALY07681.1 hypothetical protein PBI_HOWE_47 [Gordonia phage Howe]QFP96828.1 hypothetical protein SEA_MCKLOVIN_43 [Gordonia phage Mcklovin]